jgi:aspartyl-tRNA(Asn)/glutamyl-tRNA(Gln) amidotransferase subunit A
MQPDPRLVWASAAELSALMVRREVSAVEVARNALARLRQVEPLLNAFVHVDEHGALAAAQEADRRFTEGGELPPLNGIPVAVKDLIDVRGMPCTYGSRSMLGHVPSEDAPSVARLRRAGAVILGKTTTSEFGYRGYTESLVHGVTRNPWDIGRTPGGSSGGAVASVAAGVTPLGLATDGGGSIRSPCAFTGLFGIKAQFGRVPIAPASATPTLAHVGPVGRDLDDVGLLLRVIAGPDDRDWTSLQPPLPTEIRLDTATLRVAYSPTLGYGRVDADVAAVVEAAVGSLAAQLPGLSQIETVCEDPAEILAAEFIAGVAGRLGTIVQEKPELIDPPLREAIRALAARPLLDYAALLRRRVLFRERMRRFFEDWDVLLTPTTPVAAWALGTGTPPGHEAALVWSYFTYPFNLTGQPACSLPCGFTASGLPVGMQIVVRPQCENVLLTFARAARDWIGVVPRRPPV